VNEAARPKWLNCNSLAGEIDKVAAPTLKSALNNYLGRPHLTEADRAHLKRWLDEVRDPAWVEIAADANRCGELPLLLVDGPYSLFIGSALRARRLAESQQDTPALQRKRKNQREQRERLALLELADKMEEVVRRYGACKKAHPMRRVPSPSGPLPDLPWEEAKRSLEWLRRETHRLRQVAEKVAGGEPEWDSGLGPVRVSRQSGGKGKRAQSRELGVFMQQMVNCMKQYCGKPRYDAVATITNIAFPDENVLADHVRSACRTAKGRNGVLRQ
jgi:hypothetical protein